MSSAEIHTATADRVAALSAEQAATLRRAAEFVSALVADLMAAPPATRAERYALALESGRDLGLLVECLPPAYDAEAERDLGRLLILARAIECVTRQPAALH